jgi:hypothetical protein
MIRLLADAVIAIVTITADHICTVVDKAARPQGIPPKPPGVVAPSPRPPSVGSAGPGGHPIDYSWYFPPIEEPDPRLIATPSVTVSVTVTEDLHPSV